MYFNEEISSIICQPEEKEKLMLQYDLFTRPKHDEKLEVEEISKSRSLNSESILDTYFIDMTTICNVDYSSQ